MQRIKDSTMQNQQQIPHTNFKAKVLAICTIALFIGMTLVCFFPESQTAISTMVSAFLVFGGAVVGARAWQQNAYRPTYPQFTSTPSYTAPLELKQAQGVNAPQGTITTNVEMG